MIKLNHYKFEELYEMSSGISSKPEQAGHGTPFVSFSTVFNNYFLPDSLPDLMEISEKEKETFSVKKGDIFLTRTSETLDELGISCVALKDYSEASFSGFVKRLRPKQKDVTYDKFMAFYLRSDFFRKAMNNNAIMTLRASLNEQIFSYLELKLPEYNEQKKIGDFLFLINSKIELNKKMGSELEALCKLLYDYWFMQFEFPNVKGKPYKSSGGKMVYNKELNLDIPECWSDCKLGEIVERTGTGLNPRDNFKLGEGSNYYVTIKNIEQGRIVLDKRCDKISDNSLKIIDKRADLRKGDILFTSIEPVGITYLIRNKPTNWNINESVFTIRPNYEKVTSEFLFLFLSGDYIKVYTKNVAAGSIHKGIRHSTLKECKLPLPTKEVIDSFSKEISPILSKIEYLHQENAFLLELTDWLLPMLMNGQATIWESEEKLRIAAEPMVDYNQLRSTNAL